MKLEFWHKDMIRFMTDASEYGDYYRQLTEQMRPWLSANMHICDAGSGLGYLSLALAPYVRQVTAVEKHPDAAAVLSNNCQRRQIPNVISRCGSIDDVLPAEKAEYHGIIFFSGKNIVDTAAPGNHVADLVFPAVICQNSSGIGMLFHSGDLPNIGGQCQGKIAQTGACITDVHIFPQPGQHLFGQLLVIVTVF